MRQGHLGRMHANVWAHGPCCFVVVRQTGVSLIKHDFVEVVLTAIDFVLGCENQVCSLIERHPKWVPT